MSNPVGRPTKYKPEYCELLIEHMAQGLSFECFGAIVGCSRRTVYDWLEMYPEFLHAREQAEPLYRMFWEKLGACGITGKIKNFNGATYIFTMKNRFGWRDKVEHIGAGELPDTSDKAKALLDDPDTAEAARKVALALSKDE